MALRLATLAALTLLLLAQPVRSTDEEELLEDAQVLANQYRKDVQRLVNKNKRWTSGKFQMFQVVEAAAQPAQFRDLFQKLKIRVAEDRYITVRMTREDPDDDFDIRVIFSEAEAKSGEL
eukprot:TRINITY_DN116421_c0_g1_i1.p1 TRINITY_DN116421_c0_g1~~TRINITY_DN116421_c0_g1_i1.p1  ORF type:complete len:129 (-),score=31.16 TRINITY_DN116421_c0_g1_i1:11-370(-)